MIGYVVGLVFRAALLLLGLFVFGLALSTASGYTRPLTDYEAMGLAFLGGMALATLVHAGRRH